MKAMIGTTVGAYRITKQLSEGGMGSVWNATHTVMGKDAVIKFLLPELSNDQAMVRRFFNEATAAASIHDPGIVNVFDVGTLPDGRAFIVMEKLRGHSLSDRLRSGRMRVEQAAVVLRLLARSLEAAHANGIVHRDLKPDNIFLVPDREVPGGERTKILDFGIAKLGERGATMAATRAGSIFGTPAYMAPEQCSDASTVDPRADLYALGCIAYEMLSGTPPFGQGGLDVLAAHLRDEPLPLAQRLPGIHPGFAGVIHRLLRKEPNERYASAGELVNAIDALRLPPPGIADGATIAASVPPHGPTTPVPGGPPPPSYPPSYPPSQPPTGGSYPPPQSASYPPPAAASYPPVTTHGAASGMVVAAAPRKPRWWLGVVGGLVVAGGIAVAVIATSGGGSSAAGGPVAENLLLAQTAMRDERWDDALMASMKVLAAEPTHLEATELSERSKLESSHSVAFRKMQKSSTTNDYPALVAAYQQIAADSVYHARATELRAREQAEWLDDQIPPVIAAAREGDCAEHGRMLAMIETHVPPGEERLNAIRDCRALGKAPVVDAGVDVAAVVVDAGMDAAVAVAVVDKDKTRTPRDRTRGDKGGTGSGTGTGSVTKPDEKPDRPDRTAAAADPDAALTSAKNAIKAKQYREALRFAESALAARPGDGEAQMFATIAACGLGNVSRARAHLPRSRSSYRDIALERCSGMGHNDLE
jgi:serine/threonine protein kinase